MTQVDFRFFDCDNHYYEALDAFTRHMDPKLAKRAMQWVQVAGKTRLMVGEKVNKFIPNPTFDPISKPGALHEYFRGRNPAGADARLAFGDLDPMADHPEYRDRDARLAVIDEQGMLAAIFLPTLAVGMEQALIRDPAALVAAFRAFNRWLVEDWGFAYEERIFAAPIFTLVDPDAAVAELEWALDQDARFLLLLPGPVITPAGGRSPSDPALDPFWSIVNEAGATVVVHGGDSWYSNYLPDWGESSTMEAFRQNPFRRLPNLRIAAIETGSEWVFHLHQKLKKSWGQTPHAYPEDPRQTFKRHVWVSPFYEDPLGELRDLLGVDRILMGS